MHVLTPLQPRWSLLFSLVLLSCMAPFAEVAAETWKAGVARTVITPDGPYWMGGYASRKRPSDGTLQDLHAKAVALQDPHGNRLVIVTMDLLVITPKLARGVAAACAEKWKLRRDQLLLNCSHTHCGPEIRLYREEVHSIPGVYANKMRSYVQTLQSKLTAIVGQALEDLRPAELMVSSATADFAINRRNNRGKEIAARRASGTLRGPVDHAVPVLHVQTPEGKSRAILFGYACHNTTLSIMQTCGDYAGYAQAALEKAHPGGQAMFVMGAGGDQNPHPRRTIALAQQHGQALAAAVRKALAGPQRQITGRLRTAIGDAPLEFQPHPPKETLQKQLKSTSPYQRWKAGYLLRELAAGNSVSRQYKLPVQAAAVGNQLLLVAIGGETVVDYSLKVKRRHASEEGPLVWVAGYSNDVFGYLPSLRVLREGGYEGGGHMVYTRFPGPFTETVEQRVLATVHAVVEHVQRK